MKAIRITISALLLATLVSCGEEGVERRGGAAVDFSTRFPDKGMFSRSDAGLITGPAGVDIQGGFDVWTYSHTGVWNGATDKTILLDNTGAGYARVDGDGTGNNWSYGDPEYWPEEKNLSFFAYAPHIAAVSSAVTFDGQGVPIISYSVPAAISQQVDLMIADDIYDRTSNPNPVVTEMFNHALARLKFSAQKVGDLGEVVIESLKLTGLIYDGTTTLVVPVVWTPPVGAATRDYTFTPATLADWTLSASETNSIPLPLTAAGDLWTLMMPQTISSACRLELIYTIDGIDYTWEDTIPLPTDSPGKWLPGGSYNYKLGVRGDQVIVTCGSLQSANDGTPWGDY